MANANVNDNTRLSAHFTLAELTRTSLPCKNVPTKEAEQNLKRLCDDWLETLRYWYNMRYVLYPFDDYDTSKDTEPLIITQGYRSPELSALMKQRGYKPSTTSNHLTGNAVDIRCAGLEQALRYATLLLDIADDKRLDFDELFIEWNSSGAYWVHFAARQKGNRRKVRLMQG